MAKRGQKRGSRTLKHGGRALTSARPAEPAPVVVRYVCPICQGPHPKAKHSKA